MVTSYIAIYRWDSWNRQYGSKIKDGDVVEIVLKAKKGYIVRYCGEDIKVLWRSIVWKCAVP